MSHLQPRAEGVLVLLVEHQVQALHRLHDAAALPLDLVHVLLRQVPDDTGGGDRGGDDREWGGAIEGVTTEGVGDRGGDDT
eukprot:709410-Prorocentrum_minimum.AAC.1